jgi:hypothetical protein
MATYQFGFYAFDQVTVTSPAGQAGVQLTAPGNTQGVGTPGEVFALTSATPTITTVKVEDDDPLMTDASINETGALPVVSADSPFGAAGQRVDLGYRIRATTSETPPRVVIFHVVSIGGLNVGIVGTEPLVPKVSYTITLATDQQTATQVRDYGLSGPTGSPYAGQNALPWAPILCLTQGTMIETPEGPRCIDELAVGDLVTTLDNGSQPLRWIGRRPVSMFELLAHSELRPIRFETGAMGNTRPLMVSPQHRMLLNDWRAEVYFGEDQVLIPAKSLVDGGTVRQVFPEQPLVYCHLLFDRHEMILANGALCESFHPGATGLDALDADQRAEIAALFPDLSLARRRAAFPIVKPGEARVLVLPG